MELEDGGGFEVRKLKVCSYTMKKLEQIGYWYLRLNSFLTIPNFVVHPDTGSNQRTEIDAIAVRFAYRRENLTNPMEDDHNLIGDKSNERILLLFVEMKKGKIEFNETWRDSNRRNLEKVLRAVGTLKKSEVCKATDSIYKKGTYNENCKSITSLCCIGSEKNNEIRDKLPDVKQITWEQVACFMHKRFNGYKDQKRSHSQWDRVGKCLYNFATNNSCEQFKRIICP